MPHPSSSPARIRRPVAVATLVFLAALSTGQERDPGSAGWREGAADVATADELGWPAGPGADEPAAPAAPLGARFVAVATLDEALADEPDAAGAGHDERPGPAPAASGQGAYPHPVEFLTVVVDGAPASLAFMDVSPTGPVNGRTALLLHDRGEAGDRWAATIAALSADGYRVLVPDQVGHGRSGRPAAELAPAELAAQALVLLDSLGAPRVAVVGAGLGAEVAVRLASDEAGVVERLAIVAPAAPAGSARGVAPALRDPVRARPMPVLLTHDDGRLPARLGRFLGD